MANVFRVIWGGKYKQTDSLKVRRGVYKVTNLHIGRALNLNNFHLSQYSYIVAEPDGCVQQVPKLICAMSIYKHIAGLQFMQDALNSV